MRPLHSGVLPSTAMLADGASRCTSAGQAPLTAITSSNRPAEPLTSLTISVTKPRAITRAQLIFSRSDRDN
jgi:hypothetical protein